MGRAEWIRLEQLSKLQRTRRWWGKCQTTDWEENKQAEKSPIGFRQGRWWQEVCREGWLCYKSQLWNHPSVVWGWEEMISVNITRKHYRTATAYQVSVELCRDYRNESWIIPLEWRFCLLWSCDQNYKEYFVFHKSYWISSTRGRGKAIGFLLNLSFTFLVKKAFSQEC